MRPPALLAASLALAGTAIVAALIVGALALFTDADSAGTNTFATANCFPSTNTGLLDASTEAADTGGDGDGFELNPTNAFADGGGVATNVDGRDDRHRFYDYGISIHSSCTISGIEVRLDWYVDSTADTSTMDVKLSWDGGTSWSVSRTATNQSTSEVTETLGGAADTWGRTWAVSDFSDANFRIRITSVCSSGGSCNARDFFLDWAPVKIYYTQ
ncbi:MAG: hypothetical protein IH957_04245 [Chloroflexi bacterium]|nr:hypothetical protein [Chloroflexota bacterium]